jgi:predicted O-methyltransferase YrrM
MARVEENPRYDYIEKLYVNELEWQSKIRHSIASDHKFYIQLRPLEGKLLCILLKLHNAKKVIELGTLVGYSTSWILRALPQDGSLVSIEKSLQHFEIATKNLSVIEERHKLKVYNIDALSFLETCEDESVDAIFIDADKINYPNYLDQSRRILKSGGLIIADNTMLFDQVLVDQDEASRPELWEAMQNFNAKLADQKYFESLIIPTVEGLSVAIKK